MARPWAARLSFFIALATLVAFALLGLHILADGPYEMRTVIAMSIRSTLWVLVSIVAYRAILRNR